MTYSRVAAVLVLLLTFARGGYSYSVLTHEAIIDSLWDPAIKNLLLAKYPAATPDDLMHAHAFAYGGAIIQDMGYYPFGSKFFSDLLHYTRSGDFIVALLADAQNVNEYAFALGALSHYAADNDGHSIATNRAVPMLYPKLQRKFGNQVTYEDNPAAHLKTEFGFDVVQVARGDYAPKGYHDLIGFEVAKPVLERAFEETYSLPLKSVVRDLDLSIGSYRWTISSLIPTMTKVAWAEKEKQITKATPTATRSKFIYRISRARYRKDWGTQYQQPGPGARFLAWLLEILPKVGPFKALAFRVPTPEAEQLFMQSFTKTAELYKTLLAEQGQGDLKLADANFDTGQPVRPGGYHLQDETYAKLVDKMADNHFAGVSETLRADVLGYYADPNAPDTVKKDAREWAKVQQEVAALKGTAPAGVPGTTGAAKE